MASSYAVYSTGAADRALERLPDSVRARVLDAIHDLGDEPRPPGATKLQGRDGYRIRVGDYRALYLVYDESLEVTIYRIAHRLA